jgi:hypothetical protein
MDLNDKVNFYEVLEVSVNATLAEIRASYSRALRTLDPDNLASYSLLSEKEREKMVSRIEEAYQVLSHPEKRREYDANAYVGGEVSAVGVEQWGAAPRSLSVLASFMPSVASIDRVPPMDATLDTEHLLVPPDTSIETESRFYPDPQAANHPEHPRYQRSLPMVGDQMGSKMNFMRKTQGAPASRRLSVSPEFLEQLLQSETISGSLLKEIREALYISLEELSFETKISRRYLSAIEHSQVDRLPASVYVRGFIGQIAKALQLPVAETVEKYMKGHLRAR